MACGSYMDSRIRILSSMLRCMHRTLTLVLVVSLLAACGAEPEARPPPESVPTTEPAAEPPATETTLRVATDDEAPTTTDEIDGPDYDVFLAAIADTLIGTRFEALPYEEPELFAATGLLLCERIDSGAIVDEVVFEYLGELTGEDPASADDDQLTLAGALTGASQQALCPTQ